MADLTKLVKLSALNALASRADSKIQAVETKANAGFKDARVVNGNQIALYTATYTEGATAAVTLDLPSELVIDASKTTFVPNFTFNSATYPGATDPSLDNKPVIVLAVKTTDKGADTYAYSFIDVHTLVDTYTAKAGDSAKILNINGYEIEVKISATTGNHLTVNNDGLMVDVDDKADKVANATAGNLAGLDANGNLTDSGIVAANVLVEGDIAADADVTEVLDNYFN